MGSQLSKLIIARFRSFVHPSVRHTLAEKAVESMKWLARQLAASHLTSDVHWPSNVSCSLINSIQKTETVSAERKGSREAAFTLVVP